MVYVSPYAFLYFYHHDFNLHFELVLMVPITVLALISYDMFSYAMPRINLGMLIVLRIMSCLGGRLGLWHIWYQSTRSKCPKISENCIQ